MMLKVLLYAYSTGVTSSREIDRRCVRDIAFRWLSGNQTPDYRSVARFRKRHLGVIGETVHPDPAGVRAGRAGEAGTVALDGTKVKAAASEHKAMSYERLGPEDRPVLRQEVADLLAQAEATDQAEDTEFGVDRRGDEGSLGWPPGRRGSRSRGPRKPTSNTTPPAGPASRRGRRPPDKEIHPSQDAAAAEAAQQGAPGPKTQRNFTDPDARIMTTAHGFDYTYNAQAVVHDTCQVIVAATVVQNRPPRSTARADADGDDRPAACRRV